MTEDQIREKLRLFMMENIFMGDGVPADFTDDTSFLETGIFDSTGILELVQHLEEVCDLIIDDKEFLPENLDTMNRASAFFARKHKEKHGEPNSQ